MAGMGGRMSTVIKAKISKLLDQAEDPGETLDYSYQRQLESLQGVQEGHRRRGDGQEAPADAVPEARAVGGQAGHAGAPGARGGQRGLARTALEHKNVPDRAQSLDPQVGEARGQQQKLTDSEQKLRQKIEAFRTKKEVIKAQYSAAEAQVRISEAATGVGEQMADVGLAMQRATDRTEQMRARADAVAELEAAGRSRT